MKMKLKIKIIITLFFYTIISPQTVEEIKEALEYYPIHIGDKWQYKVQRKPFGDKTDSTWIGEKEVLGDTLMPNGKRYFVFKETNLPEVYFVKIYLRIDSLEAKVHAGHWYNNGETLVDTLLASKWNTIFDCYICLEDTIKEYFGQDVRTKLISLYCECTTFDERWELARGLGEVMRFYHDMIDAFPIYYQCDLIYAKINGQEFGMKSDIEKMSRLPL